MLIEAIASTVSEALELERLGVDRIELVTAVTEGGLTPSLGLIETVTSQCTIPVNVMLKTRKDYQMDDKDFQMDQEYVPGDPEILHVIDDNHGHRQQQKTFLFY